MSQVILTGRLENIEERGDEAIFRDDLLLEDRPVVAINQFYTLLTIKTHEGKVALVKFCNEVPDSYVGKDVMYVHDDGRTQLLMTGKLHEDEHSLGISLKSPEKHSLISRILGDVPAPTQIETRRMPYVLPEAFYKIQ